MQFRGLRQWRSPPRQTSFSTFRVPPILSGIGKLSRGWPGFAQRAQQPRPRRAPGARRQSARQLRAYQARLLQRGLRAAAWMPMGSSRPSSCKPSFNRCCLRMRPTCMGAGRPARSGDPCSPKRSARNSHGAGRSVSPSGFQQRETAPHLRMRMSHLLPPRR